MTVHPEQQYLNTLQDILDNGTRVPNRTGVDTIRVLGVMHKYDFKDGFPLFTTKKVWMKGVAHELLWFLSGSQNIKHLVDNGVGIWNDDAYRVFNNKYPNKNSEWDKEAFIEQVKQGTTCDDGYTYGDLGPVYGSQWRSWDTCKIHLVPGAEIAQGNVRSITIDQIANLIHNLKTNPGSRRHILSAWNVKEVDQMGLPPCHVMSQYTIEDGKLWCHMYQRSCDMFLGVPFNVASYSLLTYMLAQVCGLEPGGFIHTMHDTHIYANHVDAVKEQLTRAPRPFPKLALNREVDNIDDFVYGDIQVEDYNPLASIKAELNVG